MKKLITASIFLLSGCVSDPQIDTSNKEPACTQGCSTSYSSCLSGAGSLFFPITSKMNCNSALKACVQACPDKGEAIGGAPAKQSIEDKLKDLKRLRDAGLISNEVYLEQQKAILGRP